MSPVFERWRSRLPNEDGSAIVEFVLVGALLTVLTLSVIQLGLVLLIRNTVQDAASEGARYGALADNNPADSVQRTKDLITTAIGPLYAKDEKTYPCWSNTSSIVSQGKLERAFRL